ncbi:MAG TPA: aminoacetone oxidase family FAD-binding enzyme [Candidatus Pullilachnospira gallistercoris]|uniref:Aminoacetone oxidase family FAD-binding enzyme n=1 Tax=Candidatus Pullilachnospira gallistercoris TaxID=2840911 RepID=A0A9D1EA28_9FIRM|nr:aminoacetone oxidase family FAD-binding enzyme [Candidatus Pullilachnospira gallistercoris]
MSSVIVVGGGAAGMMAAVAAGRRGHRVTLLEKNEKLGKKIYITGKGRCNFTNACDVEQLFGAVVSNPKFLYSAIYGFDNSMTMEFFREMGMPWKVERGNRVFPVSDHSSDVTKALERAMDQAGVKVLLQTEVKDIRTHGEQVVGVEVKRRGPGGERHREHTEVLPADAVIVATGGISYPTTGSTGDGYGWAKRLGHGLVDTRPALVPMVALEDYIPAMQGLSLRNVTLRIRDQRGQRTLPGIRGDALYALWGQRSAGAYRQQSGGKKAGGGGNSRGEHRPEACTGGKAAPGTAASGIFQGAEPAFRKCAAGGIAGENGTGGGGAFPHPRASAGQGDYQGAAE